MQYKYVNEKTVEILCEEGLEEWFWKKMYQALMKNDVILKKSQRSFYDETKENQSKFLVIQIKRTN